MPNAKVALVWRFMRPGDDHVTQTLGLQQVKAKSQIWTSLAGRATRNSKTGTPHREMRSCAGRWIGQETIPQRPRNPKPAFVEWPIDQQYLADEHFLAGSQPNQPACAAA